MCWLDIYVIQPWQATPFVAKAEIARWPLIGWFAHRVGTVFIQRERRRDAHRIVAQLARRLAGERICLFPEGTTSDGHDVLPFHANLFQAAIDAHVPVQPICLLYTDAHGRRSDAPAVSAPVV